MAVLTNPVVVAQGGAPDGAVRWAVVSFKNVTANDTFDFAAAIGGLAGFAKIWGAVFVAATNRTATLTVGGIAGTVITMAGTGIANDGGYCFVVGV